MVGPLDHKPKYAEFFAGGGMVSAALAPAWDCALANDIDPKKCLTYRENFPEHPLIEGDIASLDPLTEQVDLFWASSPCQDFSLAGRGQGLRGARSNTFTHFADILDRAAAAGTAPRIVAFENVVGLVTRNGSKDFHTVLRRIGAAGYRVGAIEIDAVNFLPHSRPRLFVGVSMMSQTDKSQNWFNRSQLTRLKSLIPPAHTKRLAALVKSEGPSICFAYKRGRPDATGKVRQVAELRFDGNAGCIRTPAGGSSRQIVLVAGDGKLRARLLNPREAVRLMGLPDSYALPERFNDAYKIAGDGVAVPVVQHLDVHLFQPLLRAAALDIAA